MAEYYHGIKVSEQATSTLTEATTSSALPVVIGTAPVHLTSNPAEYVNKPIICYEMSEAVAKLGYSDDWSKYTLSEATFAEFQLYSMKPIIFINVLNPAKHKESVTSTALEVGSNKEIIIDDSVLLNTLKITTKTTDETPVTTTATLNEDYTAAYNDEEKLVISIVDDGALKNATEIYVEYDKLDTSKVTEADIIGGVNANGNVTGLELINSVFTTFGVVPTIIAAPGWSQKPLVASVMKAKAETFSSLFSCVILTDIDTAQVTSYNGVNAWKNSNSYTGARQLVGYPCWKNGDKIFNFSTILMCTIQRVDAANDNIPYMSPSNQSVEVTGMCLKDGTEVNLSLDQANMLNSQGIITGLNINGWRIWGNRTAIYPSSTDPKDVFVNVRRVMDWLKTTFILSYWQLVDRPLTRRLIRTLIDSEQIRLNALTARGYLLGGRVEFLESDNSDDDIMAGKFKVHRYIGVPTPAETIESVDEYDTSYIKSLFTSSEEE